MAQRDEQVPANRCQVVERDGRWVVLIDNEPRLVLPPVLKEQRGSS